jgi:hypothetical protein
VDAVVSTATDREAGASGSGTAGARPSAGDAAGAAGDGAVGMDGSVAADIEGSAIDGAVGSDHAVAAVTEPAADSSAGRDAAQSCSRR